MIADLKRKKDSFYFPGKDSTNEYGHGYGHIAYYSLSNFLFSCIKHSPSLAMWGKLHSPKSFPVCVCGKKPTVKLVTRKPITASPEELEQNPRARSASLRIIEKL